MLCIFVNIFRCWVYRVLRHIHFGRKQFIYLLIHGQFDQVSCYNMLYLCRNWNSSFVVENCLRFVVNVLVHRFHKCKVHCSFAYWKSIFQRLSVEKVHIRWRLDITKSNFYLRSPLKDKHWRYIIALKENNICLVNYLYCRWQLNSCCQMHKSFF